jgi:DinB superfamily
MESVANDLQSVLKIADSLRQIDESTASVRPKPGKWSNKEILGHLIDSAANNQQRFVRLQLTARIDLPGYQQDDWVRLNHYQDRRWQDLVDLWQMYNTHLATVIRHVDPKALKYVWHTPSGEDVDLEFIIRDYVVHMRHHLDQLLGTALSG